MIFANLFAITSNPQFVLDVKDLVLSLLADEQLEVSVLLNSMMKSLLNENQSTLRKILRPERGKKLPETQETLITGGKREKILRLVGKRVKILQGVGMRGKIFQGVGKGGKFYNSGKCGKCYNLETNTGIVVTVVLFVGVFCSHFSSNCFSLLGFSLAQVREMAAVTFSGLVHYGFFQLDDELQVRDYGCYFLNYF